MFTGTGILPADNETQTRIMRAYRERRDNKMIQMVRPQAE
jgi:hypothetical protein